MLVLFEGALTAEAALDGLAERGYAVRRLPGQGLPQALRITIGTAEQMDDVAATLREHGGGARDELRSASRSSASGLLGGSIGLAVREHLPGVATTGYDADPRSARRAARARPGRHDLRRPPPKRCAGADLVILCVPVGAMGEAARAIAPRPRARRAGQRCRLVQAGRRQGAGRSAARPRDHPGAPGRRHRAQRARRGLRQRCSTTAGASSPRPPTPIRRRSPRLVAFWEALGRDGRDDGRRAPRPGARGHQPPAAPDRLHHRRHRLATSRK